MRRALQVLVVLVVTLLATGSFAATECPVCKMAESDSYSNKAAGQLLRGGANIGLSWVELVNQPVKEVQSNGFTSIPIGIGKGIGHTCLRILEGAGEIMTCPAPRAKEGQFTQIADDCPLGVIGVTDH